MKKNNENIQSSSDIRHFAANLLFTVVFLIILILPLTVDFFNLEKTYGLEEKRDLKEKPEFLISKDYARKFEDYYNDNFGLRKSIIGFYNKQKLSLFKVSTNPDLVQIGKNGFLMYNSKKDKIYESYSNTNLFSQSGMQAAVNKHLQWQKRLAGLNIKYIIGFWPNKHSIYPENLPGVMKRQIQSDSSLADQAVAYFEKKGMYIFDVRSDMIKAKEKYQLYCKFDSHWNSHGAYEAYRSFCRQTYHQLKLTPHPIEDFDIKYEKTTSGDLINILGVDNMPNSYDEKPEFIFKGKTYVEAGTEGFPDQTTITINKYCCNDEVIIVFRDSYTSAMVQFLSLHFYKVIYIWDINPDMDIINKVKPDVVMSVSVERYLSTFLK
jgi:hypothetical protein